MSGLTVHAVDLIDRSNVAEDGTVPQPVTHTMSSGGFPGEPPTNVLAVDLHGPEEPALTDWRGQPIEVGTVIIWRQGTTYSGTWKIGRVTEIQKEPYTTGDRAWSLCVEWVEESWSYSKSSGKARGVMPYNVTVWPGGVGS